MGKSKATQRIERVFAQLREEGKLDRPLHKPKTKKEPAQRQRCRNCRRFEDFTPFRNGLCGRCVQCCKFKYDPLPESFVSCRGCPLDS